MTDIFREIRQRVTAQDAARYYGLSLDRRGWALCPFHNDKHPSMSFKGGLFRCWVCDIGGDSIDLTSRLLGLDALGAAERLNQDFMLGLPIHRKPSPAEAQAARRRREVAEAHREFEAWRSSFIQKLDACFRVAQLLRFKNPDELTDREVLALRMQATFEYQSDILAHGTPAEQAQLYRERGEIVPWIDKVLNTC